MVTRENIDAAVEALAAGEVVVFPTDTVYGIGVMVSPDTSPDLLSRVKQRDASKPFAWLVADASALDRYGLRVPSWAKALADEFWPGPLTLVVPTSAAVASRWAGPTRTVALRVPDDEDARALIEGLGAPIAASSANYSGRIPPRAPWHLAKSIRRKVSCVVEGGLCPGGIASTVVDATGQVPVILRPGPVSADEIERVTGMAPQYSFDLGVFEAGVVKAPLEVPMPSGDGVLRGFTWLPSAVAAGTEKPVATVHLVHGMVEFIDRYDDFARFLASRGYAVTGVDLPAHGDSVSSPDEWGMLPLNGGADLLVLSTLAAFRYGCDRWPDVPHLIFAHSMGTFVSRALVGRTDEEGNAPDGKPLGLAGLILSGTGGQAPSLSKAGNTMSRLIAAFKGESAHSKMMNNMVLGAYNKPFEPARTPCDWLSRNEESVDAYIDEPRDSFSFSVGGYAALTALTGETAGTASAARVPKDLPMLFVSGANDPVGEMGAGVTRAAGLYRTAGVADVELHLLPDLRHEILNEPERDDVYQLVLSWIEEHLSA